MEVYCQAHRSLLIFDSSGFIFNEVVFDFVELGCLALFLLLNYPWHRHGLWYLVWWVWFWDGNVKFCCKLFSVYCLLWAWPWLVNWDVAGLIFSTIWARLWSKDSFSRFSILYLESTCISIVTSSTSGLWLRWSG